MPTEEATKFPCLSKFDRCDRCGSAAQIRVMISGMSFLLFCGHHYDEHEEALAAYEIHDWRPQL